MPCSLYPSSTVYILYIGMALNNVSIICIRYYVVVVLKEIGIHASGNERYEKVNCSKEEIVDDNR